MLVDTERRFIRICFTREPREDDLAALGGIRDRWLLYRHMVRARLRTMIESALKRTVPALGEGAWHGWFDRWLDEAPPRTRYIREIVPELVAYCLPRWESDTTIPAWVPELARLEAARWEVGYADAPLPVAGELSFEKTAVLTPHVRVLRASHAVHRTQASYEPEPGAVHLVVYRRPDDRTAVWAVDDFTAALVEGLAPGNRNVTDTVKAAAAELDIPIDEKLVQRIGAVLAELVSRGILLGAR
jgi:hypothetical protein